MPAQLPRVTAARRPGLGLREHALVGDGRSVALISDRGTVDWLCWPDFDSPPLLGALRDPRAGRFHVSIAGATRIERHYAGHTPVLETRYASESGVALVHDFMPVELEVAGGPLLAPERELLRLVRCERGAVEVVVELAVKPDYHSAPVRVRHAGRLGVRFEMPDALLALASEVPLEIGDDGVVRGRMRLIAGDSVGTSLVFARRWPAVLSPLGLHAREALAHTIRWWTDWSSRVWYAGPWRDQVLQSALCLKLLFGSPAGAAWAPPRDPVAPEPSRRSPGTPRPGPAQRAASWLGDGALIARALYGLGFDREADRLLARLLDQSRPRWFSRGTGGSRDGAEPATELIDAMTQLARRRGQLDRKARRTLTRLGRDLLSEGASRSRPPRPGAGRPDTIQSVLRWAAADRLLLLRAAGHLDQLRAVDLARLRDHLRAEIQRDSFSPARHSYLARPGEDSVSARLLLLPWYGFDLATSDRMRGTWDRIQAELGAPGGGFYEEAATAGRGAVAAAGFWAAEYLAMGGGAVEEALGVFESQLQFASNLGLLGERLDPWSGAALDRFPFAGSHVGLINAALTLSRRLEQEEWRGHRRTFEWPPAQAEAGP
jgi:GH15 family glucan-1,4-alpha-glucosidase